jgi:hypothetical protein
MDNLRQSVAAAFRSGDAERLSELLGELHRISASNNPNLKNREAGPDFPQPAGFVRRYEIKN